PAWAAPAGPETIVPADPVNAPEPGQERDRVEKQDDDIVVNGRRHAIQDTQNEQIRSESFVSIVSGEELRAQPQQNLADLLTRLPG
ncbi:hypothetical protein INQ23_28835, partial [Escherichia coli]|nr:hypothetical protein [Escherichia coli]